MSGQTTDAWRGDQLSKFGGQLSYGLTDTLGLTVQATAKPLQDRVEGQPGMGLPVLAGQRHPDGARRPPAHARCTCTPRSIDVGFSYPWLRLPDEVYSQVQLSDSRRRRRGATPCRCAYGSVTFQARRRPGQEPRLLRLRRPVSTSTTTSCSAPTSAWPPTISAPCAWATSKSDIKTDIERHRGQHRLPASGEPQQHSLLRPEKEKGKFTSIGYQYDNGTWLSRQRVDQPRRSKTTARASTAFYLMGGRRFGDFLAHVTYAQLDDDAGRQSLHGPTA